MKILILEDEPIRITWFLRRLCNHDVKVCVDSEDAIECLKINKYDLIFLDHDLGGQAFVPSGPGTGYEVAQFIATNENKNAKIVVHSHNYPGARNMCSVLPDAQHLPFGSFNINF